MSRAEHFERSLNTGRLVFCSYYYFSAEKEGYCLTDSHFIGIKKITYLDPFQVRGRAR